MKKIIITIIVVLCMTLIICFMVDSRKDTDIAKTSSLQIQDFNVAGRTTLKSDGQIYVGNNLKELENNFYDIKITNSVNEINVYLNKLWYESYDKDYIQDEYLAKICRELSSKLGKFGTSEQFEYILYKYIKDNYIKVRENKQIEEIETDGLNLSFALEDSIVKLIIRSR